MPKVPVHSIPLIVALILTPSAAVLGQDTPKAAGTPAEELEVRQSRVVIDGETLFSVRGVTAYPAERRAGEIAQRIKTVAGNPSVSPESVTVEEHPNGSWLVAGGQRLMVVFDEDAALEETTRSRLAEVYRSRISESIVAFRRDRHPAALWSNALLALSATGLLLLSAYALRRIVRVFQPAIERRYRAHIEGFEDRSLHIVKVEQIWRTLAGLLNIAWGLGLAAMVYAYLNYVLALFPWTRSLGRSLFAIAVDPLRTMGLGLIAMIPNLVFLAILILVTRYTLRVVRVLFDGLASGTVTLTGFEPEWAPPTYRLIRILVIAFALIVAYPYIPGSESGAFKGVSLFMGIIFSLGSSSLIGNIIAGYSMTYRRAFKRGDRVKIGEHIGDVEQMRLLVTHLRTPKNEEVVVPNSVILSSEIVNYSSMARDRGLILHTTVGIGYETPWRQVEAMLIEAAERTPGLRQGSTPFVLQKGLGDFCVTYEINVYCDAPNAMMTIYTELHRHILDVFNEYGVQIMTPAYESDPQQPKIVPKDQWYAAPARLPEAAAQSALGAKSTH
jgi:small-conductance mechanosensitive channel